jgi:hypothetical protein
VGQFEGRLAGGFVFAKLARGLGIPACVLLDGIN